MPAVWIVQRWSACSALSGPLEIYTWRARLKNTYCNTICVHIYIYIHTYNHIIIYFWSFLLGPLSRAQVSKGLVETIFHCACSALEKGAFNQIEDWPERRLKNATFFVVGLRSGYRQSQMVEAQHCPWTVESEDWVLSIQSHLLWESAIGTISKRFFRGIHPYRFLCAYVSILSKANLVYPHAKLESARSLLGQENVKNDLHPPESWLESHEFRPLAEMLDPSVEDWKNICLSSLLPWRCIKVIVPWPAFSWFQCASSSGH